MKMRLAQPGPLYPRMVNYCFVIALVRRTYVGIIDVGSIGISHGCDLYSAGADATFGSPRSLRTLHARATLIEELCGLIHTSAANAADQTAMALDLSDPSAVGYGAAGLGKMPQAAAVAASVAAPEFAPWRPPVHTSSAGRLADLTRLASARSIPLGTDRLQLPPHKRDDSFTRGNNHGANAGDAIVSPRNVSAGIMPAGLEISRVQVIRRTPTKSNRGLFDGQSR
jgi:hypothetical protein